MKAKGINFFEQHAEKIVLGLVLLVLAAVILLQFAARPMVTVNNQPYPPGDALQPLEREALDLAAAVNAENPAIPDLPEMAQGSELARIDAPLLPNGPTRVALTRRPTLPGAGSDTALGDERIADVRVPAPVEATAAVTIGAVDPYFVADNSDVMTAYVNDVQPYDLIGATVEARFSGTAFRELLSSAPDGERAIPRNWWASGVPVVRVDAERQARLPDGSWGPAEPVAGHAPSRTDLSALIQAVEPTNSVELNRTINEIDSRTAAVLRPEYPDLIAGRPWAPPLFQPEEGPSPEDIASNVDDFLNLNRRIIRAQEDIADLEERLRRIREREAADRERDGGNDGSRPGGRGGAPGMGGGVSGGSSGGGEDDGPSGSEDSRSGIERRIDRLREDIERDRERMNDLGIPDASRLFTPLNWQEAYQNDTALLDNDAVALWVHDLAVEPGTEYRYRLRVAVVSPLLGQIALQRGGEDDRARAAQAVVEGEWSDWSEPVETPRREYYFVSGGNDGETGLVSRVSARVEMYELYYGFFRQGSFNAEPGQQLTTIADLPENLLIVDTEQVDRDTFRSLINAGGAVSSGPSIGNAGPQRPQEQDGAAPVSEDGLPEGITRVEPTRRVSTNAFLLDVVSMVLQDNANQRVLEVLFREGSDLERRTPRDDTASAGRAVAELSSQLGLLGIYTRSEPIDERGAGSGPASGPPMMGVGGASGGGGQAAPPDSGDR